MQKIIPTLALLTVLDANTLKADDSDVLFDKTMQSLDKEAATPIPTGNCSGDCTNGKGTMLYSKGEKYVGEWKNGKFHGKGVLTYEDGGKYEGNWENGIKNGYGTGIKENGDKYVGEWKNGKFHGKGTLTESSGDSYSGEWQNGKPWGHGIAVVYGDKYEGEFKNGKLNGKGILTESNGSKYDGEWQNGKKNGRGIYTQMESGNTGQIFYIYDGEWKLNVKDGHGTYTYYYNSNIHHKYEGEWYADEKDGYGTCTYTNGDIYVGEWLGGEKNGRGIETTADGSKYEGEWKDGDKNGRGIETKADGSKYEGEWHIYKHGRGIETEADGSKYEGEWKHGSRKGHGIETKADGSKYEGEWDFGDRHGHGIETNADGSKYEGEWKFDERNGHGIETLADGTRYEGEWKRGKKVGVETDTDSIQSADETKNPVQAPAGNCVGNCINGQGTLTEDDGDKYVGSWKNGQKEGKGIYTRMLEGKFYYRYEGQWKADKEEGQGVLTEADGGKYVGSWKNGKKEGKGTYKNIYGDGMYSTYEGQWKNDKKEGQGIKKSFHGKEETSIYKGAWKNGKEDGQGTLIAHGRERYVGEWKEGKYEGQGTYTEGDTKYVGQWKNGLYDGQGTLTKKEGHDERERLEKYEGEWKDGKYEGQGTYTYIFTHKGTVITSYTGGWKNGLYYGQGTLIDDGNKYVGEFDRFFSLSGALLNGTLTTANGNTYIFKDGVRTNANNNTYIGEFDVNTKIAELEKNPEHETDKNLKQELKLLIGLAGSERQDLFYGSVSDALDKLALFYVEQNRYEQAEPLYLRALTLDSSEKAVISEHLTELYEKQGRYDQIEPLYLRKASDYEAEIAKNYPKVAEILKNPEKSQTVQNLPESKNLMFQATLNGYATTLAKLADVYSAQGKYEQAEPVYKKSLAASLIYGEAVLHDSKLITEDSFAVATGKKSAFDEMMENYQSVNNRSVINLAEIYLHQNKLNKAQPLLQKALAVREKYLQARKNKTDIYTDKDMRRIANLLAKVYQQQGQPDKAEPLYVNSLAAAKTLLSNDDPEVAETLNNLAGVYAAKADYEKAMPLYQKSLRATNEALDHWLWGAGEKTRQAYLQKQQVSRNSYLSFYSLANTPEEALYFSLSSKGLLLRVASETNALAKQSADPAIQKQTQEFNTLKTQLASLTFSGKAEDKAQIQTLEENINTLEMQLSQKVASFKRSQTEVTANDVLEKLQAEHILIDFLIYKEIDFKSQQDKSEHIIALLADKQNGIKLIKLGELAPIAKNIQAFQKSIAPRAKRPEETDSDYADYMEIRKGVLSSYSKSLFKLVWQPLLPYLTDKKQIYVIPDGILHLFPFKALQDKQGHYLAEKQQITLLSSARDIVLPPLEAKTNDATIFAAPVFGNKNDKTGNGITRSVVKNKQDVNFEPLEGAEAEGKTLTNLIKAKQPIQLFQGQQASEAEVAKIKSPRFLHFATHGFFLENIKPVETKNFSSLPSAISLPVENIENPLTRSGLALTGANFGIKGQKQADGTDGILTALEVLGLNLEGTDLVTLSACETGVGDIQVGEGVYSLNRAFQEAGAKNVLSTLWTVADEQTKQFMQAFYTLVLNGDTPQQALQKTQLKFINDKNLNDPFFWAAFTVTGV